MAKKKITLFNIFNRGILKDNPVLSLLLGTCPVLAVTTSAFNGIGMGVAATFVLICSNLVISLIRNMISDKVRIPVFITVIAGFVTILQFLLKAYVPALDKSLGIFIPLITVNCIILGRAEAFASKNKPIPSIIDGLGMGVGFTLALFSMGAIREVLGNGTFFGATIPLLSENPMLIFILPPGGFFVFGLLIAASILMIKLQDEKAKGKKLTEVIIEEDDVHNCAACSAAPQCGMAEFRAMMHPTPGPSAPTCHPEVQQTPTDETKGDQ